MSVFKNIKTEIKQSDIFSHLGSVGYLPRWAVLIIDLFISLGAFVIANFLAFDLYYNRVGVDINSAAITLTTVLFLQILWFWIFHSYSGVIRYTTYVDLLKIGLSVLCNVLFVLMLNFIFGTLYEKAIFLKLSVMMYGVVAFLLLIVFRIVAKSLYQEMMVSSRHKELVVVYGVKSAGISIAQMLINHDDSKYYLTGFISDEKNIPGQNILGKPIFSMLDRVRLLKNLKKRNVTAVIVSPIVMREAKIDDLNWFLENNINVLNLPLMKDWKEETSSIEGIDLQQNLRKMQIEDLLGRTPIKLDEDHISDSLKSKVVLITGAAGSIGSEIARQVIRYSPRFLILLDNAETALNDLKLELTEYAKDVIFVCVIADVRQPDRVDRIFEEYRPHYVYHAAAYKHVPIMEDYPSECVMTNVCGSINIANSAVKYGVSKFVLVSTDKAVNPTNVMGASKRIAEIYVQSYFNYIHEQGNKTTKFITTRFGNVLGSNGSVIPLFRKQIEAGGPITVTHPEIIRYFMTIPEACQLVLEAGVMGLGGEIYVFDMGKPVKIIDLAKKMIYMSGLKLNQDIKIEFTGLRPGEKLYEELLNSEEETLKTNHEKIMIAKVREYNFVEVSNNIDTLLSLAREQKDYLVVKQMKKIVPEYKSKNSRYEQIDIELR